jgi:hypothetical protein
MGDLRPAESVNLVRLASASVSPCDALSQASSVGSGPVAGLL